MEELWWAECPNYYTIALPDCALSEERVKDSSRIGSINHRIQFFLPCALVLGKHSFTIVLVTARALLLHPALDEARAPSSQGASDLDPSVTASPTCKWLPLLCSSSLTFLRALWPCRRIRKCYECLQLDGKNDNKPNKVVLAPETSTIHSSAAIAHCLRRNVLCTAPVAA